MPPHRHRDAIQVGPHHVNIKHCRYHPYASFRVDLLPLLEDSPRAIHVHIHVHPTRAVAQASPTQVIVSDCNTPFHQPTMYPTMQANTQLDNDVEMADLTNMERREGGSGSPLRTDQVPVASVPHPREASTSTSITRGRRR